MANVRSSNRGIVPDGNRACQGLRRPRRSGAAGLYNRQHAADRCPCRPLPAPAVACERRRTSVTWDLIALGEPLLRLQPQERATGSKEAVPPSLLRGRRGAERRLCPGRPWPAQRAVHRRARGPAGPARAAPPARGRRVTPATCTRAGPPGTLLGRLRARAALDRGALRPRGLRVLRIGPRPRALGGAAREPHASSSAASPPRSLLRCGIWRWRWPRRRGGRG